MWLEVFDLFSAAPAGCRALRRRINSCGRELRLESVADFVVGGATVWRRLDSHAPSLIDGAAAARVVRPPVALVPRTGGVRALPRQARTLAQGAGI